MAGSRGRRELARGQLRDGGGEREGGAQYIAAAGSGHVLEVCRRPRVRCTASPSGRAIGGVGSGSSGPGAVRLLPACAYPAPQLLTDHHTTPQLILTTKLEARPM